jgi:cell division protein FtsA
MSETITIQHKNITSMDNREAPVIAGLDIGTTKIAVIAGRKNEYGKLEIVGFGRANSVGVQHGQVLNIEQTIKAIKQAMNNLFDSNPDLTINEVYVGVAGHHIKSLQTRGDIVRQNSDTEIERWELEQLIANQRKTFIPAGDEIIEVIPQDFYVDSYQNVKDPVGMPGVKVGANFHIITGDRNAIRNIQRAVTKSELKIKDLVLQPLASSSAVMGDVDMESGVVILDIGGGTSDLAIFCDGILRHTAVIPFGGENITNDIRVGLQVLKSQAEAMKVQYGTALMTEAKDNAFITIPGYKGMPPKEISVKNLAGIIQARMAEILDFVVYHINLIGLDKRIINGGLVLTGGGSQLKHLKQLTEYITGISARIGLPNEHLSPNHIEELRKPMYATCIGLILKGYNDYENKKRDFVSSSTGSVYVPDALVNKPPHNKPDSISSNDDSEQEQPLDIKHRSSSLNRFWEKFKSGLDDLFREDGDNNLN